METSNIIERALELAREHQRLWTLRNALIREGYSQVDEHLSGKQIREQIKARMNRLSS